MSRSETTERRRRVPEVDHDALLELTRQLVRIPSVYRPEDGLTEAPAAALVADRMRAFGWDPFVEEVAPGRPNVIAVVEGGLPGPTLLFEGHTDVVTEGDPESWTHDPFGAEVVDGRLYGRGAADMKGGLAAMIHAVAAVGESGRFPGRVILAALVDEEGMMRGAKAFVARGHARGIDAAIVCEPEGGEICAVQKGAVRLEVEVTGRMAHAAMPDRGLNPIPALSRFLSGVAELEEELQGRTGVHPHLGRPFLTPTVLAAGSSEQMNVIPSACRAAIDIRTVPGIDHGALFRRLEAIATKVRGSKGAVVQVRTIDDRPPTSTAEDHRVVRALAEAHREVYQNEAPMGGVPGTTDGTILWRDARIPVVVYGPGGKWIAHQADEYVEIDELRRVADVYALATLRFLGAR